MLDLTLGKYLVAEGLAESFGLEVVGDKSLVGPYCAALSAEEIVKLKPRYNAFSALFMMVQTLDPQAFAASGGLEVPVVWQRMVYFSYSTLTTLGYGDITPRSAWAQSLAAVEAMLGLLYIAVIIGRLVGGYRSGGGEQ